MIVSLTSPPSISVTWVSLRRPNLSKLCFKHVSCHIDCVLKGRDLGCGYRRSEWLVIVVKEYIHCVFYYFLFISFSISFSRFFFFLFFFSYHYLSPHFFLSRDPRCFRVEVISFNRDLVLYSVFL